MLIVLVVVVVSHARGRKRQAREILYAVKLIATVSVAHRTRVVVCGPSHEVVGMSSVSAAHAPGEPLGKGHVDKSGEN